jgi:hypothetical protein
MVVSFKHFACPPSLSPFGQTGVSLLIQRIYFFYRHWNRSYYLQPHPRVIIPNKGNIVNIQ